MTPSRGRKRSPRRTRTDERRGGPGGCSGGGVKTRRSRGRFGARLVGGGQNALQLAVDVGRQGVGIREGEQAVHLGAGRLDLVVPLLEELVVRAAVGELREEHRARPETVQGLLEAEEVLAGAGLLDQM